MSELIIVSEDLSVSVVAVAKGVDLESEAKKIGATIHHKNIPDSVFLKMQDGLVVADLKKQLSGLRKEAVKKVTAFANQCRRQIAGDHDHLETAEWSEKRLRALRILSDEALPGDYKKIETEALYREKGENVNQLANKIAANANRYENASIIITGMTAAAVDAINKAETTEAITSLLDALKVKAETELAKL